MIKSVNKAEEQIEPMMLSQVGAVAGWHDEVKNALSSDLLDGTIDQMLEHFHVLNVYVDVDMKEFDETATEYSADLDKLRRADLVTLRKIISYHKIKSEEFGPRVVYWKELAENFQLLAILRNFQNIYNEVAAKTPVY